MRAVPRLCIEFIIGIYRTTEENQCKPQTGQAKSALQITAEQYSFGRLGHCLAVASTGLLATVTLGYTSGDKANSRPK